MREKNKDLIQKNDDLTNLIDQIKYDNIDLKLKLDEYNEVNEQNVILTSYFVSYSFSYVSRENLILSKKKTIN